MYFRLTLIEAIVNSRSLTPLSLDPNDLSSLSLAHFLIGESLTTPVDRQSFESLAASLATAPTFLAAVSNVFSQLQERSKWRHPSKRQLQIGT